MVAGTILGGAVALLFAPLKGSETRKRLAGTGTKITDNLSDLFVSAKEKIKSPKQKFIMEDEMDS